MFLIKLQPFKSLFNILNVMSREKGLVLMCSVSFFSAGESVFCDNYLCVIETKIGAQKQQQEEAALCHNTCAHQS